MSDQPEALPSAAGAADGGPPAAEPSGQDGPLILLIEDNEDSARLVQRVLANSRFRLIHTRDGRVGKSLALQYRPDLILLDLGLPDIAGHDVARYVRAEPSLRGVKLVAFSAWDREDGLEMVRDTGCDAFIQKPFEVFSFVQRLEEILALPASPDAAAPSMDPA